MKYIVFVAGLILTLGNYAMADVDCRLYTSGVDQGIGIVLYEQGGCFLTNGYHMAEYTSKVTDKNGVSTYLCTNKHPYSWYVPAMKIVITDTHASMQELTNAGWVSGPEIRCK